MIGGSFGFAQEMVRSSLYRQREEKKISFLASINGGEEFEGDKGSDLITCSLSDKHWNGFWIAPEAAGIW
ncbi:hypothetical protein M0R45_009452 [Rubus argutus]|uniref:Uncharacterized protein n=1 Tax=Rubus argutus TaxID=59490 RepID=A0AAW1Y6K9_RUBAR